MKKEVERAYIALKNGNVKSLRKISDDVIKKSGVSQNSVDVSVAVLIYSLSKFVERGKVSEEILLEMKKLANNFNEANLKRVFLKLNKIEVRDVFGKAKIHKASSLHEHGISLGKVSSLLGVSKWDLMDYVGGKSEITGSVKGVDVVSRVEFAKKYRGDLVFDSGVIITLSLNNLLGKLKLLKKEFGEFYITNEVKRELVDKPMKGRKFKLEALQIQRLIDNKILKVHNKKFDNKLLKLSNSIFYCDKNLKILSKAEVDSFLLAVELKCVYVVDERTMRMLIEDAYGLEKVLERKMRCNVEINEKNLSKFKETCSVKVLRSVELMMVAYSKGYFKDLRGDVLDALLWGLKLRGSSISFDEIKRLKSFK